MSGESATQGKRRGCARLVDIVLGGLAGLLALLGMGTFLMAIVLSERGNVVDFPFACGMTCGAPLAVLVGRWRGRRPGRYVVRVALEGLSVANSVATGYASGERRTASQSSLRPPVGGTPHAG
jgi:hypothetical protein